MIRRLITMTYFYTYYFNQFGNVLECYEETTVRKPAAAIHTHKQLFTLTTVTTQGSYMKFKISNGSTYSAMLLYFKISVKLFKIIVY